MEIEAEEMALCGLLPTLSPSVLLKLFFFYNQYAFLLF